jgi:hypothetical protein
MLEEYVVEGANFVAIVPLDIEVCGSPFIEAATITLEYAFRPQCKRPDGSKLLIKQNMNPAIGLNLFVWKNGDIGNDKKMGVINFMEAARNAGLLDLVKHLKGA